MKIVIDSRLILPHMTGIGRYLLGLTKGLSSISANHEFELWTQANLIDDHPVWELQKDKIKFRRFSIKHMSIRQQLEIPYHLHLGRPDIYHYPHFDLPFFIPGPVVVTIHDLKYLSHPHFFPRYGLIKRFTLWLMMMFSVHRAKRVIAVSDFTRTDIIRKLHVNPDKVVLIPEGVDDLYSVLHPDMDVELSCLKYDLKDKFILFVGERRPHKNIVGLIKAYKTFAESSSDNHHLVLTGKKYSDYDEPEQLVRSLDLMDKVHFLYIEDQDLPKIYQAADAFISLSHYEGFGLPVLEAMASGTPVVAANRTSLPEVLGNAGILVDPDRPNEVANALSRVIAEGKLRDEKITAGLERSRNYTWAKCAQKTLAVYEDVVYS